MKKYLPTLVLLLSLLFTTSTKAAHDPWLDQLAASLAKAGSHASDTMAKLQILNSHLEVSNKALLTANDTFIKTIDAKDKEIVGAKKALDISNKQNDRQADTISDLESSFFSPRQKRIAWWVAGIFVVACLLKALGSQNIQVAGFGLGGVFSILAELGFGIITGGVSIVSAIFNNLWFRFWSCEQSAVGWFARKTADGAVAVATAPYKLPIAAVKAIGRKLHDGQQSFDSLSAPEPVAATVFVPEPDPQPPL